MKSAEKWQIEAKEALLIVGIANLNGFLFLTKQIQLDAWKQGMEDAILALATKSYMNQPSCIAALTSLKDKTKEI